MSRAQRFMRNWFAIEVSKLLFLRVNADCFLNRPFRCKFTPLALSRKFCKLNTRTRYAIIGVALGGAGWYMTRLARGPNGTWRINFFSLH